MSEQDEELSPEEAAKVVAMTVPKPDITEEELEAAKPKPKTRRDRLAQDIGVETADEAQKEIDGATQLLQQVADLRTVVFKYALQGLSLEDFHDLTNFFYREAATALRDISRMRVQTRQATEYAVGLVAAAARQQEADARRAEEDPEFASDIDPDFEYDVDMSDWEDDE